MAVYESFSEIPDQCRELLGYSGSQSLFFSQPWFENYVQTVVSDSDRVRIFSASPDESCNADILLPLCSHEQSGLIAPKTLSGLANFYSSRFEPLVKHLSDIPSKSVRAMVAEIVAEKPGWDVVDISPYRFDSAVLQELGDAFSGHRWALQKYFCFRNLFLENEYQDFDSYLSTRSSKIRKTTANRVRKFDRDPENRFEIITSVDGLDAGMELFAVLYEMRWQKPEPYPEFLPGLAKLCAEQGWLRLGIARVGDRPVAAQFWIVKDGVAYIFKVAYDPEFTKMSAGTVALYKMFQHVLDNEKVNEIDFLTGDDGYKRDWMDDSRDMTGMMAFNTRSARGLIAASRHIGGRAIKKFVGRVTRK